MIEIRDRHNRNREVGMGDTSKEEIAIRDRDDGAMKEDIR